MPEAACCFHLATYSLFGCGNAQRDKPFLRGCSLRGRPRRFFHNDLDSFEPSLTFGIIAIADADQLFPILCQQLLGAILLWLESFPNLQSAS